MAPFGTLFFIPETKYKAEKALIAAKFNGIKLAEQVIDAKVLSSKPEVLAKSPAGKVPFLETDMGVIFTSNAVARYIARCRADTDLYGRSFDDEGQIDTWLEFCTYELEVPLMTWVYPTLGLMDDNAEATRNAQADVKKALAALEEKLKGSEYLVGDFISLADIAVVCALRMGFAQTFAPDFRKSYSKVCAWFEKCTGLPQFKAVMGDVEMCKSAAKPKAVLPAFTAAAPSQGAKGKPKAEPKPAEKGKAEPKAQPKAAPAQAKPAPAAAAGGGVDEAAVKAKGDEIRLLKDKLKAEGLSGKKINTHEEVVKLVAELTALKEGAAPAPAAVKAPAAPAAGGDPEAAVKAKGDEIRVLKEKLKAEGLSGKNINAHEGIVKLVAELTELKKLLTS